MYFIGCDPGLDGSVVIIDERDIVEISKTKDDTRTRILTCTMLRKLPSKKILVVIEDLHTMFGHSAASNWSIAVDCGKLEGICNALGLRVIKVAPKEWQEFATLKPDPVFIPKGASFQMKKRLKDEHKNLIKQASITAANKYFPKANIDHDGVSDAINMAVWLRQQVLTGEILTNV